MTERDRLRLSTGQVGQLAALLDGTGVRTLHLDTARGRLSIELAPGDGQSDGSVTKQRGFRRVVSAGTAGEFLTVYPCRSAPMVQVGEAVAAGDLLGFIRIGALLTPVTFEAESDRIATLVCVLAKEGALVGYGAALFGLVQR